MNTAYYLITEQALANGQKLRTLEDFAALDRLVASAADYEAGEHAGAYVGAIELQFSKDGLLVASTPVADLAALVHRELMSRPEWRRRQAAAERYSGRAA